MEWMKVFLVLVLLGRAIYTDVKKGIIENRWMLFGMLSGCLWSGLTGRWDGFLLSLKMVVICFLALFLLFVIRGLGAGDIKLICVLAFFYPKNIVDIIILSFIVAAMISVAKLLLTILIRKKAYVVGATIHFSIPIGISTLYAILPFWR